MPNLMQFTDDEYFWKLLSSDSFVGTPMGDYANLAGYENATIISYDRDWEHQIITNFENSFTGTVLSKLNYTDGYDPNTIIDQLDNSSSVIVLASLYLPDHQNS